MERVKIFIADDNTDFRDRIKTLVESEKQMEVVGEAPDAAHIIKEVMESQAHVLVMDVSMPGINGLDATRMLVNSLPDLKIILVSVYDIDEYKEAALASGAQAYLVKKDIVNELIPVIYRTVEN